MELQLVSKQVAILAKELGFVPDKSINTSAIQVIKDVEKQIGKHYSHYNPLREVYLPEQELLAKWLRDVHQLWIYSSPRGIQGETNIAWANNLSRRLDEPMYFKTYEESMEDGLLRGLNHLKEILDKK